MMLDRARVTIFLVIVIGCCTVAPGQTSAGWTSVTADDGSFSVEVPSGFLSQKDGSAVTTFYRGDGVNGSVYRSKGDGKERLKWIRPSVPDNKTVYQSGEFEGFFIIRTITDRGSGSYSESVHIGSGGRYYSVSAHGRDLRDPRVRRVLDSIRLKGKPLFRNAAVPTAAQTQDAVDIAALKSSPEVLLALKRPDAPTAVIRYEPVDPTDNGPWPAFSRSLIILYKEKAPYTDSARNKGVTGSVHGRVLFRADGTIGEIVMDPSLDASLAKNCAEAARKIKFFPAEIDGKPVDYWRPITYTFDIY